MKRRIDISLAVAACGSLAVHALGLWGMSRIEFAPLPEGPAFASHPAEGSSDGGSSSASANDPEPIIRPPPEDVAQAEPEPESAKPEEAKPADPPEFVVGEQMGTGYASHVVTADQVAQAPLAETDQPLISRDPAGEFGRSSRASMNGAALPLKASPSLQEAITESAPPRPPTIGVDSTPPAPPPRPAPKPAQPSSPETAVASAGEAPDAAPASVVEPTQEPGNTDPRSTLPTSAAPPQAFSIAAPALPLLEPPTPLQPQVQAPPTVEAKPVSPHPPAPPSSPPVTASGASGDSAARPAGDPAPPMDADVDPFSQFGGADVVNGRLEVRQGRKIKPRRLNLLLAGLVDAATMPGARIVAHVTIDNTGKVTSVTVAKSSGSKAIDQATRVGLYDWWFEPKNVNGVPVGDSFDFAIRFH